jgi:phosphate-selective porin OprO and OprP
MPCDLDRALQRARASMKSLALLLLISRVAFADPPDDPAIDPPPDAAPAPPPEAVPIVAPMPTPAIAPTAQAAPTPPDRDAFILGASYGSSKLYIGGISQFDGRFFVDDNVDPGSDQFYFQTLRIDLRGTVFDHYDFRFLPDFASGKLVVQDAYVDVRYSDAIKVRFGKTKVPFGIERLQNETSTTFAQRGLPNNLVPNRDLGVEIFGELAGGTLAYQLGIFNGVADGGSSDGDATNAKEGAARVFVRPWAQRGVWWLANLGVGAAATYGDKDANITQPDTPQWKTQAQTTIFQYNVGKTDTLADTVVADGLHWRATAQGYWYAGPLGVLAEYVRSTQHVVLNGTHDRVAASAWQAIGQWVITGENATYNSVTPTPGTIGAFDVVARVERIELDSLQPFDAGFADPTKSVRGAWSGGVGVDWFANKAFRAVLDLERTWFALGAAAGADRQTETSIEARVQLAF